MPRSKATFALLLVLTLGLGFGLGLISAQGGEAIPVPEAAPAKAGPGPSRSAARQRLAGMASAATDAAGSEVESAIRRASVDPFEQVTGTGRVTGEVRTIEGAPLAGVVVVAKSSGVGPRYEGSTQRGPGGPTQPAPSLEQALQRAAFNWRHEQSRRFETRTDADGRYAFETLPEEGKVSISASLEGWIVRSAGSTWTTPDAEVDFIARPTHKMTFDVVLPDGTRPDLALLQILDGQSTWERFRWSPDDNWLRFETPATRVKAEAEPISESTVHPLRSAMRFASEPMQLTEADFERGTVRLQLREQHGIRVSIEDPKVAMLYREVAVYAVEPGRASMALDKRQPLDTAVLQRGEAIFAGLEPGSYIVGASMRGSQPAMSAAVEVARGFAEVELTGAEITNDRILTVRCTDPAGSPLSDCRIFISITVARNSRSGSSFSAVSLEPGAYRIPFDSLSAPNWSFDDWAEDGAVTLEISHSLYGSQVLDLSEGQTEASVQFLAPASLTVQVAGLPRESQTSLTAAVQVLPVGPDGKARRDPSAEKQTPDPRGVTRFAKLPPGPVEVQLIVKSDRTIDRVVAVQKTELRSGSQSVDLTAPTFHELIVRAPDAREGSRITLSGQMSPDGFTLGYHSAAVDGSGRATFPDLLAGEYEIRQRNGKRVKVSVPSGEVVLREPRNNCLRVSIHDRAGILFRAGLRGGDVIVAIGGTRLSAKNTAELGRQFRRGGAPVTVERGNETLPVDLSGVLTAERATLGGSIFDSRR